MNNDDIKYRQQLLLSISHVASRFLYCSWKRMYFCTVCQSIQNVFIIRLKTDELQIAVKWHIRRFPRVGCKTMKFVPSIKSFRCNLKACKTSVLFVWSVSFYCASCLEWNNRGKHRSNVFRWKIFSGTFLILLVSTMRQRSLAVADGILVGALWCLLCLF